MRAANSIKVRVSNPHPGRRRLPAKIKAARGREQLTQSGTCHAAGQVARGEYQL